MHMKLIMGEVMNVMLWLYDELFDTIVTLLSPTRHPSHQHHHDRCVLLFTFSSVTLKFATLEET